MTINRAFLLSKLMSSLLQSTKSLWSFSWTTMNRAQEKKRVIRMSLVSKERKTEQQTRIYAHSLEDNREWVVYLRSISLTSFNKFDDWSYNDRDTSTALMWVNLRSCTAKHDWLEIVCINQHISKSLNLFRMIR